MIEGRIDETSCLPYHNYLHSVRERGRVRARENERKGREALRVGLY